MKDRDQTYYETKIKFLQNRIYELKKENEKLRKTITALKNGFVELMCKEDFEITRREKDE